MLEDQKYKDALRHSKMIPPQSTYSERLKQEGILKKCYDGMLDKAAGHVRAKRWRKVIEVTDEVIEENQNFETSSPLSLNRAYELKNYAESELKTPSNRKKKTTDPSKLTTEQKKAKAKEILKEKCIPALKAKSNQKILKDCKEVLKYYNLHPAAVNVAKIYEKRGDTKNSIKYYKQAIKVAPGGLIPGLKKKLNQLENQ